jgi:hypothetical protein
MQMADTSKSFDWRKDCGYNKIFQYRVEWARGPDEPWESIGIPAGVLERINEKCKGKFGWHFNVVDKTKIAYITFERRRDAGLFGLLRSNY